MSSAIPYNPQHPVAQRLHRALSRGRLGQTLLLVDPLHGLAFSPENSSSLSGGPSAKGTQCPALGLAQALLCKSPQPDCLALGCGTCRSCYRIAKQCHPNVHRVESPQASTTPEASVGIDQIRRMHQQHHLSAYEPGPAVWIIPHAQLLTPQAAAGLLKLLEEPQLQRFVLLMAPHAGVLPATLVSRCQQLFFPAMADNGSISTQQQQEQESSPDCVSKLTALIERTPRLQRLELAQQFPQERDAVIAMLSAVQRHVLRLLKRRVACQSDGNQTKQGCTRLEALQHAMDLIRRNGNRKLVVEELLLRTWP